MKGAASRGLTSLLAGFWLSSAGCGHVPDELPAVKAQPQAVECSLPPPAALQVAGDDIEACVPNSPGTFFAEVGLTISAEGHVTALRIGEGTTASVRECIRKLVPSMEFVVPALCHSESVHVELAFGGGGVS